MPDCNTVNTRCGPVHSCGACARNAYGVFQSMEVNVAPAMYIPLDITCGEISNLFFMPGNPLIGINADGVYHISYSVRGVCGTGSAALSLNGTTFAESVREVCGNQICFEGVFSFMQGDTLALFNTGLEPITACCVTMCVFQINPCQGNASLEDSRISGGSSRFTRR